MLVNISNGNPYFLLITGDFNAKSRNWSTYDIAISEGTHLDYLKTIWSQPINLLRAKLTKWPNTLKQFAGKLPTNCLSVFGHFVGLALKGLITEATQILEHSSSCIDLILNN